ncbi:MAG: diacylglycerol/lipid kinase family protein [Actinomycetota bacterium]
MASSPYGTPSVITLRRNEPRGPNGETLTDLLSSTGIDYELHVASNLEHAARLAIDAAQQGRYLVAAGNDRLIHEVVNGMLGADPRPGSDFLLAIIPGASGSDYSKTFGLPTDPADAVTHLAGEPYFGVDAGRISFAGNGDRKTCCFVNLAEIGFGGATQRRAGRLPGFMGRGAELLGFWATLTMFRPGPTRIALDDRLYEGRLCNLIVANGQFFRTGMRMAPRAHPADGRFDALIMKGTKRDYVAALSKAQKGGHVPTSSIKEYLAAKVEVSSEAPLEIQADGKFLGFTPAEFEIIPNAFRLKI